jgi:hypothetical protein
VRGTSAPPVLTPEEESPHAVKASKVTMNIMKTSAVKTSADRSEEEARRRGIVVGVIKQS